MIVRKVFIKNFNYFWSFLLLLFFEFLIFALVRRNIFFYSYDSSHQEYFLYFLIILIALLPTFLFLNRNNSKREDYLSLLPLSLINLHLLFFVLVSNNFVVNQLFCLFSFVATLSLSNDILGKKRKIFFINLASFFIFFLISINGYFAVYNLEIPYIVVLSAFIISSVLLMMYKIISMKITKEYIVVFLSMFALISAEFFIFSFFWPITSFIAKGLMLVFIYYLYWGMVGLYIENRIKNKNILSYISIVLFLFIILIIYLFLNHGVG